MDLQIIRSFGSFKINRGHGNVALKNPLGLTGDLQKNVFQIRRSKQHRARAVRIH